MALRLWIALLVYRIICYRVQYVVRCNVSLANSSSQDLDVLNAPLTSLLVSLAYRQGQHHVRMDIFFIIRHAELVRMFLAMSSNQLLGNAKIYVVME